MRVNGRVVHKLWRRRRGDVIEVRLLGRAQSGAYYPLAVVEQPGDEKGDDAHARVAAELDPVPPKI